MAHAESGMRQELERLLAERPEAAAARAASAFDQAAGAKSLVLRGAGGLGRMVARGLRALGRPPIAFIDNNPALIGQQIEDVPVLSAKQAAEEYGGSAAFLITIWRAGGGHRHAHSRKELQDLGCSTVLSFALLFWKYPERFLPYYCLDLPQHLLTEAAEIRQAFELCSDEQTRTEFVQQLRWRLHFDFDCLRSPGPEDQYFPEQLFSALPHEEYVDCGAFDGDTLKTFLRHYSDNFSKFYAFEPDPGNFSKLEQFSASLDPELKSKIDLFRLAAAEKRKTVRFDASGSAGSSVSSAGTIEVACAPLDEILAEAHPTILKMDIEGAELSALEGAKQLIEKHSPVLQLCVYHRPNDLWKIPLFVHKYGAQYDFFLRPHNEEGWDLICYAVPPARRLR